VGAFAANIHLLLVWRFLEGLGFILVTVSVPTLVLRVADPRDRHRAMTLWSCYMPAGAGAMMLIAAVVLPRASWRAAWMVASAMSALMLVALVLRAVPRQELDAHSTPRRPILHEMAEVASSGGPLAIAVCFGAYSACWVAIVGFLPTLQVERLGFSTFVAAIVTAAVTSANVAGNLWAGRLLRRGAPRGAVIAGAAASMALCAAGIFVDGVPDIVRLVLAGLYSAVIGPFREPCSPRCPCMHQGPR
jgi:fucose permease